MSSFNFGTPATNKVSFASTTTPSATPPARPNTGGDAKPSGSSLFGAVSSTPSTNLFAGIGQNAPSALSMTSAAPTLQSPATSSIFGGSTVKNNTTSTSALPSSNGIGLGGLGAPSTSLFGPKPTSTTSTPNLMPSTAAASSNMLAPAATTTPVTPTSTAPIVFPKAPFATGTTTATTAPAAVTTAPAASPFTKPAAKTSAFPVPTGSAASTTANKAQPQQLHISRLKNKSMDEILQRWSSDFNKYQKDFQMIAEQVSEWDKMLVKNTDRLAGLVNITHQAEQGSSVIQKSLTSFEDKQEELSQWFDKYEQVVDDALQKVGLSGEIGGVDVERERYLHLAEKLTDRAQGIGINLTDMIEEINVASTTLSSVNTGTSNADDPISHVVRILNSHFMQLQQIDQGASSLQAKVDAALKKGLVEAGGNYWSNGPSAADDFMKSFRR